MLRTRKSTTQKIIETIDRMERKRIMRAKVYAIDGNYVDIKPVVGSGLLRHVEVYGDPKTLRINDEVLVQWVDKVGSPSKVPIVMAKGSGQSFSGPYSASTEIIMPDMITGDMIAPGSIRLDHLSFDIDLEDSDIMYEAGWRITADGAVFNQNTYIHPSGQITLGRDPDVIKLDGVHPTYRLWVGDLDPASAVFSVQKNGSVFATAGTIAGWTLAVDNFSADSGNAEINAGTYPFIRLGGASAYMTGTGFWVGSDSGTYKWRVGNPAADNVRFDGTNLYVSGSITADTGYIGGWQITASGITADSGNAGIMSGSSPYIQLGGASAFMTGEGFWVGKDTDTTYKLRIGDPSSDYMSWDGDKLFVTGDIEAKGVFLVDNIIAKVGTEIIAQSVAVISRNFTVPATTGTLYVKELPGLSGAAVFSDGDWIRLRYVDLSTATFSDVWGTVVAVTIGDEEADEQAYTFTRQDGSSGLVIYAGATAVDYGASGDSYIMLNAIGDNPHIRITTWATNPYTAGNHTNKIVISGNEYISVGNPAPTSYAGGNGFWVGNDGGIYKMFLGETGGERIQWNGSNLHIYSGSSSRISFNAGNIDMYDNTGTQRLQIASTGSFWVGASGGTRMQYDTTDGLQLFTGSDAIFKFPTSGTAEILGTLNVTGEIVAGGGDIVIDSDGITIETDPGFKTTNVIKFTRPDSPTMNSYYGVMESTSDLSVSLVATADAFNKNTTLYLLSDAGTSSSVLSMVAIGGGSYSSRITMQAYSATSMMNIDADYVEMEVGDIRLHYVTADTYYPRLSSPLSANGILRVESQSGYIDIGPRNGSWCHIYTNIANGFYTDKNFTVGGNITLSTSGVISANSYGTFLGGVHVGGTSDPGDDNLIVDGTSTFTGAVTASYDIRVAGGLTVGSASDYAANGQIAYTSNLISRLSGSSLNVYAFYPITGSPYTIAAFDNSTFSSVGASTYINRTDWSPDIPANAKAILLQMQVKESNVAADRYFAAGPSTTYWYHVGINPQVNNKNIQMTMVCPTDGNGGIYYRISASGTNTMTITLRVTGYWI